MLGNKLLEIDTMNENGRIDHKNKFLLLDSSKIETKTEI